MTEPRMQQPESGGKETAPKMLIFDVDAHYIRDALAAEFPGVDIVSATELADARPHFRDADIVCALALPEYFSDEWLADARRLKWIQALTSGADALAALRTLPRDLLITNARGVSSPQMSEMAFMHMLNLARDFKRMLRNQGAGTWERWPQPPLSGATVALIGMGAIAEDLARRCKAFGMTVVGVASTLRDVPHVDRMHTRDAMAQALADADYVIVLLPYSKKNHHAVDARVLAMMKPGAYFLNLGRGGVVDEDALLAALRSGAIAGAGLDVFATEPLPPEHPFWAMDNVIITAHLGGMSTNYKDQVLPVIRANLRCFLAGDRDAMINRIALPARA